MFPGGPDHYKPMIQVGDHVHMAWHWLLDEKLPDIAGRVIYISPRNNSFVASLDGNTYKVHAGNLEHLSGPWGEPTTARLAGRVRK